MQKGTKQLLLLGIIAMAGTSWFLARNAITVIQGTRVTAEVLNVKTISTSGSGTSRSYQPTVKYKTKGGNFLTLTTGFGSSMYNFDRGDKIPVYYKTSHPSDFRIATFGGMWAAPLTGLVLSLLILFGAYRLAVSDKQSS